MSWKHLIPICVSFLCLLQCFVIGVPPQSRTSPQPEIWMAFFHGLGGNSSVNIPLIQNISKKFEHQGVTFKYINPQLPNDVSLEEWSNNIAQAISTWAKNETQSQPWIILVGHSMGGKAGLHAAAHNLMDIDRYVESIITINSPIKNLGRYRPYTYVWNGFLLRLITERYLHINKTVALKDCRDIDTTIDGKKWVEGLNRTWLSFISSEAYPTDPECDLPLGNVPVDLYPRYMDDGLVPIDAQYSDDSTTVYYGICGHQAMVENPAAIQMLSTTIVRYLTGEPINISRFSKAWVYDHKTLSSAQWVDIVGRDELVMYSGIVSHAAGIFPPYQWIDVVGGNSTTIKRSRYDVRTTFSRGSHVKNISWLGSSPFDFRIAITSQALPNCKIDFDYQIYGIIPQSVARDHYEVEVIEESSYGRSRITYAGWTVNNCTDTGITIRSWAAFGTVGVGWKIFLKEAMTYPDVTYRYHLHL